MVFFPDGIAFFHTIPGIVRRDTKRLAIHSDGLLCLCYQGGLFVRIVSIHCISSGSSKAEWLHSLTQVDK